MSGDDRLDDPHIHGYSLLSSSSLESERVRTASETELYEAIAGTRSIFANISSEVIVQGTNVSLTGNHVELVRCESNDRRCPNSVQNTAEERFPTTHLYQRRIPHAPPPNEQIDPKLEKSFNGVLKALSEREARLFAEVDYAFEQSMNANEKRTQFLNDLLVRPRDVSIESMKPLKFMHKFYEEGSTELMKHIVSLGVVRRPADARNCIISGLKPSPIMARQSYTFTVHVKDSAGRKVESGGDKVTVESTDHYSGPCLQPKPSSFVPTVLDGKNGSYNVSLVFDQPGTKIVLVKVNGEVVRDKSIKMNVIARNVIYQNGMLHHHPDQQILEIHSRRSSLNSISSNEHFADPESAKLCRPWGICMGNNSGTLYVADRGTNRIIVMDEELRIVRWFGRFGTAAGEFNRVSGVAYNHTYKHLVVCDKDNHRIQIFEQSSIDAHTDNATTTTIEPLIIFGSMGTEPGQFQYPWDVAVSNSGIIAVTDTKNKRVQLFTDQGIFMAAIGGDEDVEVFKCPRGVAFFKNGWLAVTDMNTHRVMIISSDHDAKFTFGEEGEELGQLKRPQGVVVTKTNRIVVADSRNYRIQVFNFRGHPLAEIGHVGQEGLHEMDRPSGVCAVDDGGSIMVVDYGNDRVTEFSIDRDGHHNLQ